MVYFEMWQNGKRKKKIQERNKHEQIDDVAGLDEEK